jgi:hypothetical protein
MAGITDYIPSASTLVKGVGIAEAGLLAYNYNNDPNNSAGARQYMGNYMYPSDLVNTDIGRSAYMSFKFKSYERRSIFAAPFLRAIGGITLPLPASLQDATSVNWTASTPSAQSAAVGAGIEQLIAPTESNKYGGSSNAFKESVLGELGASTIAAGAAAYGGSQISDMLGGGGAQVLALKGLAQNPFMTMLFQSPNFKSHSFSWVFAPRNQQESLMIAQIIEAFKFNMLPGLAAGTAGTFFSIPNIADISLYPANKYLYRFKPCCVKSVTADYAPNGPSFFIDSFAPTHISLSIELQEIEMWTKEALTDSPMNGSFMGAIKDAFGNVMDSVGNSIKDTSNIVNQENQEYFNPLAQPGSGPNG